MEKVNRTLGERYVTDIRFKAATNAGKKASKETVNRINCEGCGASFQGEKGLCPVCRIEKEEKKLKRVYCIIGMMPWAKYDDMAEIKNEISADGFMRIKRNMKHRMMDELIMAKNQVKKDKWEKMLEQYAQIVMNKKCCEISEADMKGIRKAAMNKVGNYYRKGTDR